MGDVTALPGPGWQHCAVLRGVLAQCQPDGQPQRREGHGPGIAEARCPSGCQEQVWRDTAHGRAADPPQPLGEARREGKCQEFWQSKSEYKIDAYQYKSDGIGDDVLNLLLKDMSHAAGVVGRNYAACSFEGSTCLEGTCRP